MLSALCIVQRHTLTLADMSSRGLPIPKRTPMYEKKTNFQAFWWTSNNLLAEAQPYSFIEEKMSETK